MNGVDLVDFYKFDIISRYYRFERSGVCIRVYFFLMISVRIEDRKIF